VCVRVCACVCRVFVFFKWFFVTKTVFQVVASFKPRLTVASVKLPGVCVCVCVRVGMSGYE